LGIALQGAEEYFACRKRAWKETTATGLARVIQAFE